MKVTLLAHTAITDAAVEILNWQESSTEAEHLTTLAGRLCYESFHRPNPDTEDDRDYIRSTVIQKQHYSIVEHASATFLIEGVSRNLTHELIRHRHLSFSQLSQRFCDESDRDFVMPPAMVESRVSEEFDLLDYSREGYEETVTLLAERGYTRKQAREAARYFLLSGMETKIVVTGNHRAWYEMLNKRLSPQADAEIRKLAQELLGQLRVLAPSIYEGLRQE